MPARPRYGHLGERESVKLRPHGTHPPPGPSVCPRARSRAGPAVGLDRAQGRVSSVTAAPRPTARAPRSACSSSLNPPPALLLSPCFRLFQKVLWLDLHSLQPFQTGPLPVGGCRPPSLWVGVRVGTPPPWAYVYVSPMSRRDGELLGYRFGSYKGTGMCAFILLLFPGCQRALVVGSGIHSGELRLRVHQPSLLGPSGWSHMSKAVALGV